MKTVNVTISDSVRMILEQGTVDGCIYFLPQIQLGRTEYTEVNRILELLGGKWNRSKKGHVFASESEAKSILGALEEGSVVDKKKTYQFFQTPVEVARKMVELAEIQTGMSVLEPSAGHGAILEHLPNDVELYVMEVDSEKCQVLLDKGYIPQCVDFLTVSGQVFDRILMNPPFTRGQDVDHVLHAYDLLSDIGTLVAVTSSSVTFNQQKKYQRLRELIESAGKIIELPESSFKESGTNVNTVIVVLKK